MSKRKILTLALSLCMVAILAVGGSLAYLTDTDNATNVFTVGNVQIKLNEKERKYTEDGALKDELGGFSQNKKLYPIVGSAQSEKDKFGLPKAELAKNYVDKIVSVTNSGSEAAWIRVYFAMPSALDDGYDTFNAGLNVLHFNFGQENVDGTWTNTDNNGGNNKWLWKQTNGKWNYYETTIDGIAYNVYFADYYEPVAAGATTVRFLNGVYLDKSFNFNEDDSCVAFNKALALDEGWNWNSVKCPVMAVAVQSAGFNNAADAISEAFGAQFNPFGGTVTNWQ